MNSANTQRTIKTDGPHTSEVLKVLTKDLGKSGIGAALQKAAKIVELSVDPDAGPPTDPSDGLLYGLIQSGKTSILTVTAAMAVENSPVRRGCFALCSTTLRAQA